MKIVDRYITQTVLSGTLIVLFILVGLFTFFSFIDEIDDIGKQRYGLQQVIQYIALEIPQHIYDLFPSAILLGSLLGLGILANHNELTVMRAAGLSILRIVIAVLKIGLLLTLLAMLIGETLSPLSQQYQNMKINKLFLVIATAFGLEMVMILLILLPFFLKVVLVVLPYISLMINKICKRLLMQR